MQENNRLLIGQAFALADWQDGEYLLEVGPGNAAHTCEALSEMPQAHYAAAEISEAMVAEAIKIHADAISRGQASFRLTDGVRLPFDTNFFDKAVTVNTLYFWERPEEQLAEIYRVVKPGGILCIAIYGKDFMQHVPFTAYGFRLYTPDDLVKLLERTGWIIGQVMQTTEESTGMQGMVLPKEHIVIRAYRK